MKKKQHFSEETMQGLIELGEILRRIRNRLVSEGKAKIENGKLIIIDQPIQPHRPHQAPPRP